MSRTPIDMSGTDAATLKLSATLDSREGDDALPKHSKEYPHLGDTSPSTFPQTQPLPQHPIVGLFRQSNTNSNIPNATFINSRLSRGQSQERVSQERLGSPDSRVLDSNPSSRSVSNIARRQPSYIPPPSLTNVNNLNIAPGRRDSTLLKNPAFSLGMTSPTASHMTHNNFHPAHMMQIARVQQQHIQQQHFQQQTSPLSPRSPLSPSRSRVQRSNYNTWSVSNPGFADVPTASNNMSGGTLMSTVSPSSSSMGPGFNPLVSPSNSTSASVHDTSMFAQDDSYSRNSFSSSNFSGRRPFTGVSRHGSLRLKPEDNSNSIPSGLFSPSNSQLNSSVLTHTPNSFAKPTPFSNDFFTSPSDTSSGGVPSGVKSSAVTSGLAVGLLMDSIRSFHTDPRTNNGGGSSAGHSIPILRRVDPLKIPDNSSNNSLASMASPSHSTTPSQASLYSFSRPNNGSMSSQGVSSLKDYSATSSFALGANGSTASNSSSINPSSASNTLNGGGGSNSDVILVKRSVFGVSKEDLMKNLSLLHQRWEQGAKSDDDDKEKDKDKEKEKDKSKDKENEKDKERDRKGKKENLERSSDRSEGGLTSSTENSAGSTPSSTTHTLQIPSTSTASQGRSKVPNTPSALISSTGSSGGYLNPHATVNTSLSPHPTTRQAMPMTVPMHNHSHPQSLPPMTGLSLSVQAPLTSSLPHGSWHPMGVNTIHPLHQIHLMHSSRIANNGSNEANSLLHSVLSPRNLHPSSTAVRTAISASNASSTSTPAFPSTLPSNTIYGSMSGSTSISATTLSASGSGSGSGSARESTYVSDLSTQSTQPMSMVSIPQSSSQGANNSLHGSASFSNSTSRSVSNHSDIAILGSGFHKAFQRTSSPTLNTSSHLPSLHLELLKLPPTTLSRSSNIGSTSTGTAQNPVVSTSLATNNFSNVSVNADQPNVTHEGNARFSHHISRSMSPSRDLLNTNTVVAGMNLPLSASNSTSISSTSGAVSSTSASTLATSSGLGIEPETHPTLMMRSGSEESSNGATSGNASTRSSHYGGGFSRISLQQHNDTPLASFHFRQTSRSSQEMSTSMVSNSQLSLMLANREGGQHDDEIERNGEIDTDTDISNHIGHLGTHSESELTLVQPAKELHLAIETSLSGDSSDAVSGSNIISIVQSQSQSRSFTTSVGSLEGGGNCAAENKSEHLEMSETGLSSHSKTTISAEFDSSNSDFAPGQRVSLDNFSSAKDRGINDILYQNTALSSTSHHARNRSVDTTFEAGEGIPIHDVASIPMGTLAFPGSPQSAPQTVVEKEDGFVGHTHAYNMLGSRGAGTGSGTVSTPAAASSGFGHARSFPRSRTTQLGMQVASPMQVNSIGNVGTSLPPILDQNPNAAVISLMNMTRLHQLHSPTNSRIQHAHALTQAQAQSRSQPLSPLHASPFVSSFFPSRPQSHQLSSQSGSSNASVTGSHVASGSLSDTVIPAAASGSGQVTPLNNSDSQDNMGTNTALRRFQFETTPVKPGQSLGLGFEISSSGVETPTSTGQLSLQGSPTIDSIADPSKSGSISDIKSLSSGQFKPVRPQSSSTISELSMTSIDTNIATNTSVVPHEDLFDDKTTETTVLAVVTSQSPAHSYLSQSHVHSHSTDHSPRFHASSGAMTHVSYLNSSLDGDQFSCDSSTFPSIRPSRAQSEADGFMDSPESSSSALALHMTSSMHLAHRPPIGVISEAGEIGESNEAGENNEYVEDDAKGLIRRQTQQNNEADHHELDMEEDYEEERDTFDAGSSYFRQDKLVNFQSDNSSHASEVDCIDYSQLPIEEQYMTLMRLMSQFENVCTCECECLQLLRQSPDFDETTLEHMVVEHSQNCGLNSMESHNSNCGFIIRVQLHSQATFLLYQMYSQFHYDAWVNLMKTNFDPYFDPSNFSQECVMTAEAQQQYLFYIYYVQLLQDIQQPGSIDSNSRVFLATHANGSFFPYTHEQYISDPELRTYVNDLADSITSDNRVNSNLIGIQQYQQHNDQTTVLSADEGAVTLRNLQSNVQTSLVDADDDKNSNNVEGVEELGFEEPEQSDVLTSDIEFDVSQYQPRIFGSSRFTHAALERRYQKYSLRQYVFGIRVLLLFIFFWTLTMLLYEILSGVLREDSVEFVVVITMRCCQAICTVVLVHLTFLPRDIYKCCCRRKKNRSKSVMKNRETHASSKGFQQNQKQLQPIHSENELEILELYEKEIAKPSLYSRLCSWLTCRSNSKAKMVATIPDKSSDIPTAVSIDPNAVSSVVMIELISPQNTSVAASGLHASEQSPSNSKRSGGENSLSSSTVYGDSHALSSAGRNTVQIVKLGETNIISASDLAVKQVSHKTSTNRPTTRLSRTVSISTSISHSATTSRSLTVQKSSLKVNPVDSKTDGRKLSSQKDLVHSHSHSISSSRRNADKDVTARLESVNSQHTIKKEKDQNQDIKSDSESESDSGADDEYSDDSETGEFYMDFEEYEHRLQPPIKSTKTVPPKSPTSGTVDSVSYSDNFDDNEVSDTEGNGSHTPRTTRVRATMRQTSVTRMTSTDDIGSSTAFENSQLDGMDMESGTGTTLRRRNRSRRRTSSIPTDLVSISHELVEAPPMTKRQLREAHRLRRKKAQAAERKKNSPVVGCYPSLKSMMYSTRCGSLYRHYSQRIRLGYFLFLIVTLLVITSMGGDFGHGTYFVLCLSIFYFSGMETRYSLTSFTVATLGFVGVGYLAYHRSADSCIFNGEEYLDPLECEQGRIVSFHSYLMIAIALFFLSFTMTMIQSTMYRHSRRVFIERHTTRRLSRQAQLILRELLPPAIAKHLVVSNMFLSNNIARYALYAEKVESCSIMFCEMDNLRRVASLSSPTNFIYVLNSFFTTFDHLIERYEVYKVETVGEIYMVASGAPDRVTFSVFNLCALAYEMRTLVALSRFSAAGHYESSMEASVRIGIHTGEVIAGALGVKLPRYRLFGDTVNTASRMQSTAKSNMIQLSKAAYAQVVRLKRFNFTPRGLVEVKGKGSMFTYLLNSLVDPTLFDIDFIDGEPLPISAPLLPYEGYVRPGKYQKSSGSKKFERERARESSAPKESKISSGPRKKTGNSVSTAVPSASASKATPSTLKAAASSPPGSNSSQAPHGGSTPFHTTTTALGTQAHTRADVVSASNSFSTSVGVSQIGSTTPSLAIVSAQPTETKGLLDDPISNSKSQSQSRPDFLLEAPYGDVDSAAESTMESTHLGGDRNSDRLTDLSNVNPSTTFNTNVSVPSARSSFRANPIAHSRSRTFSNAKPVGARANSISTRSGLGIVDPSTDGPESSVEDSSWLHASVFGEPSLVPGSSINGSSTSSSSRSSSNSAALSLSDHYTSSLPIRRLEGLREESPLPSLDEPSTIVKKDEESGKENDNENKNLEAGDVSEMMTKQSPSNSIVSQIDFGSIVNGENITPRLSQMSDISIISLSKDTRESMTMGPSLIAPVVEVESELEGSYLNIENTLEKEIEKSSTQSLTVVPFLPSNEIPFREYGIHHPEIVIDENVIFDLGSLESKTSGKGDKNDKPSKSRRVPRKSVSAAPTTDIATSVLFPEASEKMSLTATYPTFLYSRINKPLPQPPSLPQIPSMTASGISFTTTSGVPIVKLGPTRPAPLRPFRTSNVLPNLGMPRNNGDASSPPIGSLYPAGTALSNSASLGLSSVAPGTLLFSNPLAMPSVTPSRSNASTPLVLSHRSLSTVANPTSASSGKVTMQTQNQNQQAQPSPHHSSMSVTGISLYEAIGGSDDTRETKESLSTISTSGLGIHDGPSGHTSAANSASASATGTALGVLPMIPTSLQRSASPLLGGSSSLPAYAHLHPPPTAFLNHPPAHHGYSHNPALMTTLPALPNLPITSSTSASSSVPTSGSVMASSASASTTTTAKAMGSKTTMGKSVASKATTKPALNTSSTALAAALAKHLPPASASVSAGSSARFGPVAGSSLRARESKLGLSSQRSLTNLIKLAKPTPAPSSSGTLASTGFLGSLSLGYTFGGNNTNIGGTAVPNGGASGTEAASVLSSNQAGSTSHSAMGPGNVVISIIPDGHDENDKIDKADRAEKPERPVIYTSLGGNHTHDARDGNSNAMEKNVKIDVYPSLEHPSTYSFGSRKGTRQQHPKQDIVAAEDGNYIGPGPGYRGKRRSTTHDLAHGPAPTRHGPTSDVSADISGEQYIPPHAQTYSHGIGFKPTRSKRPSVGPSGAPLGPGLVIPPSHSNPQSNYGTPFSVPSQGYVAGSSSLGAHSRNPAHANLGVNVGVGTTIGSGANVDNTLSPSARRQSLRPNSPSQHVFQGYFSASQSQTQTLPQTHTSRNGITSNDVFLAPDDDLDPRNSASSLRPPLPSHSGLPNNPTSSSVSNHSLSGSDQSQARSQNGLTNSPSARSTGSVVTRAPSTIGSSSATSATGGISSSSPVPEDENGRLHGVNTNIPEQNGNPVLRIALSTASITSQGSSGSGGSLPVSMMSNFSHHQPQQHPHSSGYLHHSIPSSQQPIGQSRLTYFQPTFYSGPSISHSPNLPANFAGGRLLGHDGPHVTPTRPSVGHRASIDNGSSVSRFLRLAQSNHPTGSSAATLTAPTLALPAYPSSNTAYLATPNCEPYIAQGGGIGSSSGHPFNQSQNSHACNGSISLSREPSVYHQYNHRSGTSSASSSLANTPGYNTLMPPSASLDSDHSVNNNLVTSSNQRRPIAGGDVTKSGIRDK